MQPLTRILGREEVEMVKDKHIERSECEQDPALPIMMNQVLERDVNYKRERGTPNLEEWRRKQHQGEKAICKIICQHALFNNWKTETLACCVFAA